MKLKLIIFAFIVFISSGELKAQKEIEVIVEDTSKECDIYLQSRILIKNAAIFRIKDSTVYIIKKDITKELKIADIRTIKFKSGSGFWTGAAIGAGVDAAVFLTLAGIYGAKTGEAALGAAYALMFGAIGLVPSALIGGFIGAMTDEDTIYNLPKDDVKTKIRMLRKIIKENK
ncbi:MAG: hypothetical protein EHM58_15175 [Ignavibacteriae bacterium]|nr:MAG: hypothetical protein EHM58_15175 [Ignavibacteriota bacterium]